MVGTVLLLSAISVTLSVSIFLLCRLSGIQAGNSGIEEIRRKYRNDPIGYFVLLCIVAPIWEEFIFRYLPYLVSQGHHPWLIGVITAFIFAAAHGLEDSTSGKILIPIPHFFSGLFFWYIMVNYGLFYCIGVHSVKNTVFVTVDFCRKGCV